MLTFPATEVLELSTGRRLSFAVYGAPDGVPVYYMHGFYGSRLEAMLTAKAAENTGIKLIAADRPGVGESTAEVDRSLQSWASNIGELADHLGHKHFFLLGVSGGGPYALGCCDVLSERIAGISLCCSLAQLHGNQQLPFKFRSAMWAHRHFNIGLAVGNYLLYSGAKRLPGGLLRLIGTHISPADRNILKQPKTRAILTASLREASVQGPLYGAQELTIFGAPWGFELKDIPMPVNLWHGGQDEVVPVAMAYQLADELKRSSLHIMPDDGHFSLPGLHAEKILQQLTLKRNNAS